MITHFCVRHRPNATTTQCISRMRRAGLACLGRAADPLKVVDELAALQPLEIDVSRPDSPDQVDEELTGPAPLLQGIQLLPGLRPPPRA